MIKNSTAYQNNAIRHHFNAVNSTQPHARQCHQTKYPQRTLINNQSPIRGTQKLAHL